MPVWHVSVSVSGPDGIIATAELSPKWRRRAQAEAIALLDGVGEGPDKRDRLPIAFHLRRKLTPAEIERLERMTPGWCAIPATDRGGGGEPW